MQLVQDALGLLSGSFVGFSLGLVGGGGSILAVPLMIYLVGVPTAHVAIGTSAFAVAVNAAANLLSHARAGTVKWSCAGVFALAGVAGAFAGSSLSKRVDGPKLLALFALLMLVVAGVMFARRADTGDADVRLDGRNSPKLVLTGLGTGALSGFFGIGTLARHSCRGDDLVRSVTVQGARLSGFERPAVRAERKGRSPCNWCRTHSGCCRVPVSASRSG